jgi:hypothetical protein
MRGDSFQTLFHVGHDVEEAHEVLHAGVVLEHTEHSIHLALLGVSHNESRQEPQLGDPGVYAGESCKTALVDLLQPLRHNEERHQMKTPRTIRYSNDDHWILGDVELERSVDVQDVALGGGQRQPSNHRLRS